MYFLQSHLREGSSDLVSGPAINGPKTSLVPLLVLLTTELELFKYSRTCMKRGCQAGLNKAVSLLDTGKALYQGSGQLGPAPGSGA